MDRQQLLSHISTAATRVHKALGPGLLEQVYRSCMLVEMENSGIHYRASVPVPIFYEGRRIQGQKLVIDLLVEDILVVELCAVERLQEFHTRKIFTNLKLTSKPLGALINFGERLSVTAFPGFPASQYTGTWRRCEMGSESKQKIAAGEKDPAAGHKAVHALTGP